MEGKEKRQAKVIMQASKQRKLSASLEDYLEAILNLSADNKVARSKDIAEALEVSRSSVTGALRTLAEKQLVNYKPYGFIALTERGRAVAQKVAQKHNIIKSFFVNILGIDKATAGKAACGAEHVLGPQIVSRLLRFIEFVTASNKNGYDFASEFKQFCEEQRYDDRGLTEEIANMDQIVQLSEAKPGQKGKIVKIVGRSGVNKRIADMGVVPGTMVEVKRIAPLGDPIDVKLKGYHLTLRKEEASNIMVDLDS